MVAAAHSIIQKQKPLAPKDREHSVFEPPALNPSIYAAKNKKARNAQNTRYAHAAERYTRITHAKIEGEIND